MSRYQPKTAPVGPDPQLSMFVQNELEELARSKVEPDQFITLDTSNTAPSKIREGMVVLADGTNWNPGSGAGFYGYRNSAWRFLG